MSDNETIGLRVSYQVDAATVSAALNASKSIVEGLRSINATAASTSPAFKSIQDNLSELQRRANLNSVAQQFAQLAVSSRDSAGAQRLLVDSLKQSGASMYESYKAVQTYRAELKNLTDDEKKLSDSQRNYATRSLLTNARFAISDINRGDFGGAVVNAGQSLQRAGELGINLDSTLEKIKGLGGGVGTLATAAATAAAPLGTTAVAFATLSTVLLPLVALVGAGALALQAYSRGQEQANAASTAAVAALKAYYDELASTTTEQAQAQLAANRAELGRLADQKLTLINQIAEFNAAQQTFGLDGVKPLQEGRDALDKTINELIAKNKLLEEGLQNTGFATGDLARQYKDETTAFLSGIAARQGAQTKINELLESGSAKQFDVLREQYDAQLRNNEAAQAEIETKLRGMPITEENAAAVAALQAKQRELIIDYGVTKQAADLYTDAVRQEVAAREAARLAVQSQLSGIQKLSAFQAQLDAVGSNPDATSNQVTAIGQQVEANRRRIESEILLIQDSVAIDEAQKARIKTLYEELEVVKQQENVFQAFLATIGSDIRAREELSAKTNEAIKASDNYGKSVQQQADYLKSATTAELASALADNDSRRKSIEAQKADLQARIAVIGSTVESDKKLADLNEQLLTLSRQRGDIEAVTSIVALRDALKALSDGFKDGTEATAKYAEDVARIEQESAEKRADIALDYNDKLIDLAREAADKAADALRDTQRKIADETTDLSRDMAKDQRAAQDDDAKVTLDYRRSEAKAFREHLRDLEKIRREAQDKEFELAINRDFAGLFFSRRDTARKLEGSNSEFVSRRESERESLRIKLQDTARERQIEQRERLIAFQQKLADARRDYDRELEDLRINNERARVEAAIDRDRAYRDLRIANQRDFAEKQAAYAKELILIGNATKQRLAIIGQEQAAITGSITGIFGALSAGATGLLGSITGLFGAGSRTTPVTRPVAAPAPVVRRPGQPLPFPTQSYTPFASQSRVGAAAESRPIVINVTEAHNARLTAKEVSRQLEVAVG